MPSGTSAGHSTILIWTHFAVIHAFELLWSARKPPKARTLIDRVILSHSRWTKNSGWSMAHTPLKMSIEEAHNEVRIGWAKSYSPEAIEKAVDSLNHKPLGYRINIFIARLCFRGIYFPQMGRFAWAKTILENRRTIFKLIMQGFAGGLQAAAPSVATQPVTDQQN